MHAGLYKIRKENIALNYMISQKLHIDSACNKV